MGIELHAGKEDIAVVDAVSSKQMETTAGKVDVAEPYCAFSAMHLLRRRVLRRWKHGMMSRSHGVSRRA